MTWLWDILRSLLFFIDNMVYNLIDKVYSLFLEIANTTIFTNDMIEAFAGKVYALVGIFMLFKVSFSILTYIVNPDEFTDKNKGMGKLVVNIITSLAMLILVPIVFNEAMDIQRIILKDDIIPKILSTEFENGEKISISSQDPGQGSQIAYITFKTFYFPDGKPESLAAIFDTDVNAKHDNGEYATQYDFLISTAVGVVLVLLLISFCFDIALRSIKLGFLRLIAPIPIIARVDPKKGNELFNKWTKTCISTYLDLFMRLLAIFFAIYIINALQQNMFKDAVLQDTTYEPSGFAKVFIILGALMFAKQLPKLLEDMLGVKLSGNFTLNPLKKFRDVPLTSAAVGGIAGSISGAAGNFLANRQLGHNMLYSLGSGALGTLSGMYRGGKAGLKDDGKNPYLRSSFEAARKGAQTIYKKDGTDFFGRNIAGLQQTIGINTEADRTEQQIKEYDSVTSEIDSIFERANGEMIKHNFRFTDSAGNVTDMDSFKAAKENLNVLRNMDTSGMSFTQRQAHAQTISNLQTYISKTEKLAEQSFVDLVQSGAQADAEISARLSKLNNIISSSNDAVVSSISTTSGANLKTGKDNTTNQKVTVENSRQYKTAQANKNYRGNGK